MIYTLNARGNIMLEVMQSYFSLDSKHMLKEINGMQEELCRILKTKKIEYQALKSALIPIREKKEVLLLFDSNKFDRAWYGYPIFNNIIKTLDKQSVNSFLCGDYIDIIDNQKILREILFEHEDVYIDEYYHSSQFFLVYINNVSEYFFNKLKEELEDSLGFVDILDLTYTSRLKDYCSFILSSSFIKCGNKIIMGHEDDRDPDENINTIGYPFEENGFYVRSLSNYLYGVFLSYKIERRLFGEDLKDIGFSINAISSDVKNLNELNIYVEDKKLKYLKTNKTDILRRIELLNISSNELEELIKFKIKNKYIFNLEFLNDFDVSKFNIQVEFIVENQTEVNKYKVLIALEYSASREKLRLITLY